MIAVSTETLVASTWRGREWPVTGAVVDATGRTRYEVKAYLAGWLVEEK